MSDVTILQFPSLSRLLRMAIVGGVESSVRVHIERGDDLNARDGNGMTPLMLSAARNRSSICKLLLDAGADGSLLSPSGKTALEIAVASGAQDAATVLTLASSAVPDCVHVISTAATTIFAAVEPAPTQSTAPTFESLEERGSGIVIDVPISYAPEPTLVDEDLLEFDIDGWEAEEDSPPPESDQSVVASVSAIHKTITEHQTFDSSTGWDDVDIELPDESAPLLRVRDATLNQRLRRLLLQAMRHGSISLNRIEALSVNPDGSSNSEMVIAISMAINGIGAEVVDDGIYSNVIGQLDELTGIDSTLDEDTALDEALFFIEETVSGRTEPLRFYQKELQRQKLLTSQQETSLVREMEKASQAAIDALAIWPRGLSLVLATGRAVEAGQRRANSYTRGALESEPDGHVTDDGADVLELAKPGQENEEAEQSNGSEEPEPDEADHRSAQLSRSLTQLENHLAATSPFHGLARETLLSLRLNHEFMFELEDAAVTETSEHALRYVCAMRDFRCAWEQMILGNIKLAFSLAHKYRYSGDRLDDLAQEGNLGLLKAIERFDWRLGYKFSTYATWWIKQGLGRHIADKCRTIRLPVYVHTSLQRMLWETRALEWGSTAAPAVDAIAARMNIRPDKVVALQRLEHDGTPLDETSFVELMASDSAPEFCLPDPEELAIKLQLILEIERVLSTLQPKEEQVIRLRFGIGVDEEFTLEEVGKQFGVTRERIRQIEAKALKKLRHPSRLHALSLASNGSLAKIESSTGLEANQLEPLVSSIDASTTEPTHPALAEQALARLGAANSKESLQSYASVSHGARRKSAPTVQQSLQFEETSGALNYNSVRRTHPGIAKLVALAKTLEVAVDDDRDGLSGHIWFRISDSGDKRYRSLVRNLITVGFEFWPGKGYWK